ncbi:MAG: hypothetical protein CBD97_04125 [Pelagibacteraceae bacterium TMED237]|nr:MAG: hypothetical protein CBD97_04125 [Pelagibacteraceae bacterium TMED237]
MARVKQGPPTVKEIQEGESLKRYVSGVGLVNYTRYNNQLYSNKMYDTPAPPVVDKKASIRINNISVTSSGGTSNSASEDALLKDGSRALTNHWNAGSKDISANSFKSGGNTGAGIFQSLGDYDVTLKTGNSTTGSITITDGANGNIAITPNGTGEVDISKVDIANGEIDNVTLGTNSAITQAVIDNVNINAASIGHIDDTDLITLADGSVTFTGSTIIPTADINGGAIDGTVIGANSQAAGDFTAIGAVSAGTIVGTTIDATTDFTIGTLVITDDQIQMTPSTSDTITIAGASNGVLNITTVDNAAAAADINITADGDITMDSVDSIILDTAGTNNDVIFKNGGTERFAFKNDSTPEMDVTGTFTLDGSSSITIDSVGETIINTNGNVVARASTSGALFLHGATDAPTGFLACGIQMKKNIYHFSTGYEDFKENFTMLNVYKEPAAFEAYPS